MAALEQFFLAKHAPVSENDGSEDSEVDNRLEKIYFAEILKEGWSAAGFPLSRHLQSDGMTSQNSLAAKYSLKTAASEVSSFEKNFFRIADISEVETSVSQKVERLLAIGEDKKRQLFGVTFSIKYLMTAERHLLHHTTVTTLET